MKKSLLITIVIILGLLNSSVMVSQELVSTAGDSFTSQDMTIDWSLGEPINETYSNNELIITQGMHQSMFSITSLISAFKEEMSFTVFPNPTSGRFFLNNVRKEYEKEYFYEIIDARGKRIISNTFSGEQTEIDITGFSNSQYFLVIKEKGGKHFQSFQIQKTK